MPKREICSIAGCRRPSFLRILHVVDDEEYDEKTKKYKPCKTLLQSDFCLDHLGLPEFVRRDIKRVEVYATDVRRMR